MSTIDTSTWNPDPALNESIGDIPLTSNASIAQTWQAIQMLMAAGGLHGLQLVTFEGATASADGASGLVPAPEAGDQDKFLKGDGTWDALSASDIPNIDASKITSGTIDLARLPAGALERLVTVADQTARYALTAADVQLGDTVKQLDTGVMYLVVDTAKLNQAAGYVEYTAGSATSVPWSGVTGKPSTFTPSSHTHGNLTNDGKLDTVSRAVQTDANGALAVSSVTATELGYLSGTTSAVQTQLDAKAADSGVVHKTGNETVNGIKTFPGAVRLGSSSSSGIVCSADTANSAMEVDVYGAATYSDGAVLRVFGKSNQYNPGYFIFRAATSSSVAKQLAGRPDGTLTWDGQPIQTSSDERLKTPLSEVPDAVLDAWEDVNWGQFQYLDAVAKKGESARLHLGLIAQRVKAVFEARGLDACAYGILCHDERPEREVVGEDGKPAVEEAVDLWTVRYAEALAMEAAYQRRRADRLEARIAAVEVKIDA